MIDVCQLTLLDMFQSCSGRFCNRLPEPCCQLAGVHSYRPTCNAFAGWPLLTAQFVLVEFMNQGREIMSVSLRM